MSNNTIVYSFCNHTRNLRHAEHISDAKENFCLRLSLEALVLLVLIGLCFAYLCCRCKRAEIENDNLVSSQTTLEEDIDSDSSDYSDSIPHRDLSAVIARILRDFTPSPHPNSPLPH